MVKEERELPRCDGCGEFIDDCVCVCLYCGKSAGCDCCAGYGRATGG